MQIRTEYQQFEPFYKSKHNNNIVWLIRKIVLTINFSKVEAAGLKQHEATAAIPYAGPGHSSCSFSECTVGPINQGVFSSFWILNFLILKRNFSTFEVLTID